MKQTLFFCALAVLFSVLSSCHSDSGTASTPNTTTPSPASSMAFPKAEAEKLIQRLATQDGCKDSTADMRLSFTDADGKPQQIDFRLQRKYEAGKISTLMTVLAPPDESEKALLAVEEDGKPTSAISYLAGLRKVAQLKSDNPLNFRGSKSSVQEMLGMEFAKYDVTSAKKIKQGEEENWEIELKAKDGMSLAFARMRLETSARKFNLPQTIILYDSRGEKVKTISNTQTFADQKYPTISLLEIEDHRNKQTLKLETRNIKYDSNLAASLFTEPNLIKIVTAASQKQIQ